MKVVSLNVGRPRPIQWAGKEVLTSIHKQPVEGRRMVRTLNVDGDQQSDLTVHGGADKAVYAYPCEHYPFWRGELPAVEFPWGAFGENLTTEGLDEEDLSIGDVLRVGSIEVMVTQPRIPCFKLVARIGVADMVKRFLASRRSGFYFAVLREGEVGAGDSIEILDRATERMSVRELTDLYVARPPTEAMLERALGLKGLAPVWRDQVSSGLAALRALSK
jgi:MOSC domain-containing protein YiiM